MKQQTVVSFDSLTVQIHFTLRVVYQYDVQINTNPFECENGVRRKLHFVLKPKTHWVVLEPG